MREDQAASPAAASPAPVILTSSPELRSSKPSSAPNSPQLEAFTPSAMPPTEFEGGVELMSKRPKRSGKWFVCHKSKLSEIKYEEVCDIYEEFLKHHPNGGAATAGFVAVRLSDEQIAKQRDLIRISSYRWKDVKGVGPDSALEPMIPSNYLWFLEHIRERGQILCFAALKLVLSAQIELRP